MGNKHLRLVGLFLLALLVLAGCAPPELVAPPTATVEFAVMEPTAFPTAQDSPTPSFTATPLPTRTPAPTVTRVATPFIRRPAVGDSVAIPILMYHHLEALAPGASETLRTWTVAPEQFAAQLDYMQARGFHTITFKQLVEFFDDGASLPEKPVLLTFDDGWIDDYTVAFPELVKRGMVGNFFPPTRYVDAGGTQLINWDQVLEMDRAGMEFGGHTVNHQDLTKINLEQVRSELSVAKARMEARLGHPTYAFSYPFGAFNPRVVAETRAAGYRAALILCCGYQLDAGMMLTLPRIRISYGDTLQAFGAKLP